MNRLKVNIFLVFILLAYSNIGNAQCSDDGNYWIESWTSCVVSSNPNSARGNTVWLLFEFTEPQAFSNIHIWNANRTGESGLGGKTVFIDVSEDGSTWTQVGNDAYTWAQATEQDNYEGFVGPNLESFGFIEKLLFTFIDNHEQSNCISIGELRFDIDQNACYGELDACGICDGPGFNLYFEDSDGDGLGNPDSSIESCELPSGYVENNYDNCDNGLLGWDNVANLFSENGCTGCHNGPQGSGGLDLTSFDGISNGGNICGPNILTGTVLVDIISISNYDGCSSAIPFPSMNERVGGSIDGDELLLIQNWIDDGALLDCNCPDGAMDSDGDGICDASDICQGLNDGLIGTACDDGDPCTTQDIITEDCQCIGAASQDSDFDGICDALDLAPNDPCTADDIIGMPEPQGWFANESNDCDLDGTYVSDGDLNDYDECVSHTGASLNPDCACSGAFAVGGGKYLDSDGISNTFYASGIPDNYMTGYIGYKDFLDLEFPYLETGAEICFTVGFSNPIGGVQFEVNDLGIYKFENPEPSLINYEPQTVCFPTFMPGTQKVRISRFITGGIKIDGATVDFCPCTESDANLDLISCACPNDFTQEVGTYESSFGISNPQESNGAPDGVFTGSIGSGDSLILSYLALPEDYEICLDVLFTELGGRISLEFNSENLVFVNPAGIGEENEVQKLCFKIGSNQNQTVILKDIGSGSIKVDGSTNRYCNPCASDNDLDGVCDDIDICILGDDNMDEDGDGTPDACDECNNNLVGLSCDDNNECTYNDIYDVNCICAGTPVDYELVDGLNGELLLHAKDSIDLIGDFNILSNGSFKAGHSITILPGFETQEFMSLDIEIDNCINN